LKEAHFKSQTQDLSHRLQEAILQKEKSQLDFAQLTERSKHELEMCKEKNELELQKLKSANERTLQ
jgi:hypothetical protein